MLRILIDKLKESITSILPIVVIVLLLSFLPIFNFVIPLNDMLQFIICSLVLIVSMAIFNLGAEIAMIPMGEFSGSGLVKTKKLSILLITTFLMGLFITISEPDLTVLAEQVEAVMDSKLLIISVGIGVGIFLVFAILKIIFHKSLSILLLLFYMMLFAITALLYETGKHSFLPLSFDSGGVTTGPITVPFVMAFGAGIAACVGGRDSNENSFGLVSLCSVGPILVVLIFSLFAKGDLTFTIPDYLIYGILETEDFAGIVISEFVEVLKSLGLIFIFFLLLNIFILKLPPQKILQIVVGLLITLIGLVLFLSTVSIGFMPVGFKLGIEMAKGDRALMIIVGFVIGMTVVLAEPAVHVLNNQVEEITGGSVTKRSMMIALSVGVGISLALSIIRIIFGFSILYYLIPGYFISLSLTLFVPPIYTAIAFDSGGVASGPLTSTFILPMMEGVCCALVGEDKVLSLAFGVVSLVAMTPLISIQVLGFRAILFKLIKDRLVMRKILTADDDRIVYFENNWSE